MWKFNKGKPNEFNLDDKSVFANTEHIDERLPVSEYFKKTIHTVDGIAWLITCVASLICLLDILLSTNFIPLRDIPSDTEGAVVLLLFSPILIFCFLVNFRQPIGPDSKLNMWFRATLCIVIFFLINFWR
jgi:hypothetical protein